MNNKILLDSLLIAVLCVVIGIPLHLLSLTVYKNQDLNDVKMLSLHIFMIVFIICLLYFSYNK